ncbi:KH domain-containing protein [Kiritimatiella glycovorans]|uniref:RNA-binding protein KhpA n=1 Tax=Kiritimatiella glycovorans TaxID=1307763 RepID=A0A0G3EF45_9BACT|nr:KH domain-containing protein [Kiritimatiella glycovorans]AKJ63390.1 putative RNA-binding protein (contains KH domain) [Kiritimatiella glycovorans]
MKDLIENLARALVDHPDDVSLTEIDGEKTVIYELRCNKEDIGKLIGRNGKTVGAMRTLLSTLAAKKGRRVMLEVVE